MRTIQSLLIGLVLVLACSTSTSVDQNSFYSAAGSPSYDTQAVFLSQSSQYCPLVVLKVYLQKGEARSTLTATGSAFIVNGQYLVTARHVFMPEWYDSYVIHMVSGLGYTITKDLYVFMYGTTSCNENNDIVYKESLKLNTDFTLVGMGPDDRKYDENKIFRAPTGVNDYCVFKFNNKLSVEGFKLRDAKQETDLGKSAFAIGYPSGPDCMDGTITSPLVIAQAISRVDLFIRTSGACIEGMSGGPLVDEGGSVIGIVTAHYKNVLGLVIPISKIYPLLK